MTAMLNESSALDPSTKVPLFVDLDGSLVLTDTLFESALGHLRRKPGSLWRWPLWLMSGRAKLKSELAADGGINVSLLPYDERVCAILRHERARGRRIILATAADARIARAVSEHLGLFDDVIASDGISNRKGAAKLAAIREHAGGPFAYLGNSREDIPIWAHAEQAIVANASSKVQRLAQRHGNVMSLLEPRSAHASTLWRAMRPHQWLKNLLIFIPLLTSFQFSDFGALRGACIAFMAFCMCASASYLFNDLLDLDADRAHPRKRQRPFASGMAAIPHGLALSALLVFTGLGIAAAHSLALLAVVASYLLVTTAYSLHLKHFALLDVIVLSALYTWRLFAGVVAAGIVASLWLLAFALFLFLSLALLKRCAELVVHDAAGSTATPGRDYRTADLRVLWPLGIALGVSSILVFVLYANAPEVRSRFATPDLLWLVAVGLTYWLARMWLKTSRGEMTDDPIVYALRNFGSRMTVLAMVTTALAAHFIRL